MPASIVDKDGVGHSKVDKKIDSVCPYCGVGCQIEYNVKDNKIKYVNGVDGPANKNRLCVKGRFGFDYVNNPDYLHNQNQIAPLHIIYSCLRDHQHH